MGFQALHAGWSQRCLAASWSHFRAGRRAQGAGRRAQSNVTEGYPTRVRYVCQAEQPITSIALRRAQQTRPSSSFETWWQRPAAAVSLLKASERYKSILRWRTQDYLVTSHIGNTLSFWELNPEAHTSMCLADQQAGMLFFTLQLSQALLRTNAEEAANIASGAVPAHPGQALDS